MAESLTERQRVGATDSSVTGSVTGSGTRSSRSKRWSPRHASGLVAILSLAHFLLISVLALQKHRNFDTYGFDLGIYDQAWWLVGHDGNGLVTVRGLPVFGHHVNAIFFLLAPLSWLNLGPNVLTILLAATLSVGALPVSWIARERLGSVRMGVLFGCVYLLYPPTSWLSWVSFHPESLSVAPMLFAAWFSLRRRWWPMAGCLLIALSTREEVGLVVAMFGLVMMWSHRRKAEGAVSARLVALLTSLAGLVWFFVCTKIIIPNQLGGNGAFYVNHFFAAYGDSLGEVAVHLITHPQDGVTAATTPDAQNFLLDLFGPLGFLPLLSSPILMALPQLASTLLGSQDFLRKITNQYTALMVPGLMLATIQTVVTVRNRFAARPALTKALVAWLTLSCALFAFLRTPLPGTAVFDSWRLQAPSNATAMRDALETIPDGAAVAASGELVPHLSERRVIYTFPNPFEPLVYGLDDARPEYPAEANWVIVNYRELSAQRRSIVDELRSRSGWETTFDRDGVVVLRRATS